MSTAQLDRFTRSPDSRELRKALAGDHPTVSPNSALGWLWRHPERRRTQVFRSVLGDRRQAPVVRQTAAHYLGKIDRPPALAALKDSLRVRDPLVRGAVLRSLGRIGDQETIRRVARMQDGLRGWLAREAKFAVTLLAYRHGVEGYEVRLPRDNLLTPGRRSRDLEMRPARPAEREALQRSLTFEPLGMPAAHEHAYRLNCGPRKMLVVLNRDLVESGDLAGRLTKPTLAAQVLHWHDHDEAYAPIFYLLTHTQRDGNVRIGILNSGGRLCCAGFATTSDRVATFVVRAVDIPGNTPAHVEGRFELGAIELEHAKVGLAVRRSRRTTASGALWPSRG